ncbi:MAG: DUF2851 family protein [Bacteroidia bacterium]
MTEDLLHFIWKFQLFNQSELVTFSGEKIKVIHPGLPNTHAGPDFFNAKIKIGDTLWAGNIEIHVKTSDFIKHQHSTDKNYDNLILHVVYENDLPELKFNYPVFELKNYIPEKIISIYNQFLIAKTWIPCENNLKQVNEINYSNWIQRLAIERLERKSHEVELLLTQFNNDWQQVLFIQLAKAFGFKVNALPFELWAKSLPYQLLLKHRNNPLQIDALIFGQAGFLDDDFNNDSYFNLLKTEYNFLKNKYALTPIDKHLWKFLRLRPRNFPTIRLAQLSEIIKTQNNLFSAFIDALSTKEIMKIFKVNVSEYWQTHFLFSQTSEKLNKPLGEKSAEILIINAIVPVLFAYSNFTAKEELKEKALSILENLNPEKNSIIENWNKLGIRSNSAIDTQGLLELKNEYCSQKKCLNCSIGNYILKQVQK